MKNRKKAVSLAVITSLVLLLTACNTKCSTGGPVMPNTTSSQAETTSQNVDKVMGLSSFTAADINNKDVTEKIFAGKKLTMVNIWATFCGPCIREMPDLGAINTEYADKGFQIVGVAVDVADENGKVYDDMLVTAKEIVEKTKANYIHILPSESLWKAKLSEVASVPETIFVDEKGNQVGKSYVGSRPKDDWVKIIDELLQTV